jgi:predicted nucleic acid-binding protein
VRFWDTSALVPLCVEQAASTIVARLYEDDNDIIVWWGTRVECVSALMRLVREGHVDAIQRVAVRSLLDALFEAADEIAPMPDVRDRAESVLAVHPLRAADGLQLGAALVWAKERTAARELVSLDVRLREAAAKEGFTVIPDTLSF